MARSRETIAGLRVLVIDDEPQLARGLARTLTRVGASVAVALNVTQALRRLRDTGDWDVLLVDQLLPDGDGFDVINRIGSLDHTPAIVAISANLQSSKRSLHLQKLGAVLLPKPFDRDDLLLALSQALSLRSVSRGQSWQPSARASTTAPDAEPKRLTYENISLDLVTQTASVDGASIELQPAQFRILAQLLTHPGRRFGVEELTQKALRGSHHRTGSNIRFQIHALRRRLGPAAQLIETRDHGYGVGLVSRQPRLSQARLEAVADTNDSLPKLPLSACEQTPADR